MSVKVLVVEDHPIVRLGLRMLLDPESDVDIIGEASTAAEAIQCVDELQPNVVLMDIELPDGSGIDVTEGIKRRHPDIAIIVLTIHEDSEYVDKMYSVGASGFVSKRAAPDMLLTTIREAAAGDLKE